MSKHQQKAYDEIAKRLAFYDKAYPFLKEFIEWDATTDSWYDLFKNFQEKAKDVFND